MSSMFDSIGKFQDSMSFHRDRHMVLAGNLANLDTPGYKPRDFLRSLENAQDGGSLLRTNEAHLDPNGPSADLGTVIVDESVKAGADSNAVSLEREMAKIDANRVRYAASAELVSRKLALLRYASGDGA